MMKSRYSTTRVAKGWPLQFRSLGNVKRSVTLLLLLHHRQCADVAWDWIPWV